MGRPKKIIEQIPAGKNVVIYTTMSKVTNPNVDGRVNRNTQLTSLLKTTIPSGFVFGIDEDGNIEDRSRPVAVVPGNSPEAEYLKSLLLKAASKPLETPVIEEESFDEVLASATPLEGGRNPVSIVMEAMGITPAQFRAMVAAARQIPAQGQVSQAPTEKNPTSVPGPAAR